MAVEPTVGLNIRFTVEHKRALERLAEHEGRSQQQIVTRLLGPLLEKLGRELDTGETGPCPYCDRKTPSKGGKR